MAPMFYLDPSMKPKWPHLQEAKTAPWGQNGPNKITVCVFISVDIRVANEAFSCHKGLTANRCLLFEVWTCCDEEART